MDESYDVNFFVEEWLNHFRVSYRKQVKTNSNTICDFLIDLHAMGIFIVDWKKPISVHVVNKAIQMCQEADLVKLFLVANSISEPAMKLLSKYPHLITPVHPNGLSSIAMEFAHSFTRNAIPAPT